MQFAGMMNIKGTSFHYFYWAKQKSNDSNSIEPTEKYTDQDAEGRGRLRNKDKESYSKNKKLEYQQNHLYSLSDEQHYSIRGKVHIKKKLENVLATATALTQWDNRYTTNHIWIR